MSSIPMGTCASCRRKYTARAMSRHLASCCLRERGETQAMHLVVEGKYAPDHWMHLELQPSATIAELDVFLRDAWLECCFHVSRFIVRGEYREEEECSEAVALVVSPGEKFEYRYDFGSSTRGGLRVLANRNVVARPERIRLLALNDPLERWCGRCREPAAWIHTLSGELLCEECGGENDMCLPVVNSPREGVCAYCGPEIPLPPLATAEG